MKIESMLPEFGFLCLLHAVSCVVLEYIKGYKAYLHCVVKRLISQRTSDSEKQGPGIVLYGKTRQNNATNGNIPTPVCACGW
jgi:hypothetical protein